MQKYNQESVDVEVGTLEAVFADRLSNSFETGDYLDMAKGLIALEILLLIGRRMGFLG